MSNKTEEEWIEDCHSNPMYAAEHIMELEAQLELMSRNGQELYKLREAVAKMSPNNPFSVIDVQLMSEMMEEEKKV